MQQLIVICFFLLAVLTPAQSASSTWSFRLFGGASDHEGLLQVLPPRETEWGTVCIQAHRVSPGTAMAACRSVGLLNTSSASVFYAQPIASPVSGPIYLTDLNCPSSLHVKSLASCFYSYSADGQHEGCTHAQDLYLHCGTSDPAVNKIDGLTLPIDAPSRIYEALDVLLASSLSGNTSIIVVMDSYTFRMYGVMLLGVSAYRISLKEIAPLGSYQGLFNLTILDQREPGNSSGNSSGSGGSGGYYFHEDSADEVISRLNATNGRVLWDMGIQQVLPRAIPVTTNVDIPPCAPKYTIDSNSSLLMNMFGLLRVQPREDLPSGTVAGSFLPMGYNMTWNGAVVPQEMLNTFSNRKLTSRLVCESIHPELRGKITTSDLIPFFLSNDNGPISAVSLNCPQDAAGLDDCGSGINWFEVGNDSYISHFNDVGAICGRNLLPVMPLVNFTFVFRSMDRNATRIPVNMTWVWEAMEVFFSIPRARISVITQGWYRFSFFTSSYFVTFSMIEDSSGSNVSFTRNDLQLILLHISPNRLCRTLDCDDFYWSLGNSTLQYSRSNFVDPVLPPKKTDSSSAAQSILYGRACPSRDSTATKSLPIPTALITSTAQPTTTSQPPNSTLLPTTTAQPTASTSRETVAPIWTTSSSPTSSQAVLIISVSPGTLPSASSLQMLLVKTLNVSSSDVVVATTPQSGSTTQVASYSTTFASSALASLVQEAVKAGTLQGVVSAAPPSSPNANSPSPSGSAAPIGAIIGGLVAGVAIVGALSCFIYRRAKDGKTTTGSYDDDAVMMSNLHTINLLPFEERVDEGGP